MVVGSSSFPSIYSFATGSPSSVLCFEFRGLAWRVSFSSTKRAMGTRMGEF